MYVYIEELKLNTEVTDGKLYINIKKDNISSIVKSLVLNNIDIEATTECEKNLENLFFDVTKEEKKDE